MGISLNEPREGLHKFYKTLSFFKFTKIREKTYEVWKFEVNSCLSSPAGLIVNILETGMPTAL